MNARDRLIAWLGEVHAVPQFDVGGLIRDVEAAAGERGRRAEHERAQSVIHVLHQCIRGKCDCGPGQFACEETARTVIDSWDLAPRDSGPVIASSGSVFEDDE